MSTRATRGAASTRAIERGATRDGRRLRRNRRQRSRGTTTTTTTARASRTNDARARDRDRDDYDVHTVMYGDTLNEIARAHGTSAEAVCEANGIRFDDEGNDEDAPALYVGQRLLIPTTNDDGRSRRGEVGEYGSRRTTAMSERERDAEFARARRSRSEQRRMSAPTTRTHAVVSASAVEELTRDDVVGMLTHRDETVMLLVETENCRWCDDVQPAWTAVAVCYANDPTVRVCRLRCDSAEMKQFAAKYFRAKTFPTIVALPAGKGPVYRHASADRSVGALLEFAEEATGRTAPTLAIDLRKSPQSASSAMTTRRGVSAASDASSFSRQTAQNPFNALTGALGSTLGFDGNSGRSSVGVSATPSSQVLPLAAGITTLAIFAAVANVAVAARNAGAKRQPRRLGRHFHEEEFADDHEPLDDYDEAVMEVSSQNDARQLAEWRDIVVEELFSLPSRALLLIRIWFLIGRRSVELGKSRSKNERRGGRSRDEYEVDEYYEDERRPFRDDGDARRARPSRNSRDDPTYY